MGREKAVSPDATIVSAEESKSSGFDETLTRMLMTPPSHAKKQQTRNEATATNAKQKTGQ
ncbi:MAG: hypothetical protein JNL19_03390 [Burkholderiales bacterium]|nr:hypothetical protein [Burkholderiales bacterium]